MTLEELQLEFQELKNQFKAHKHTGLDSQKLLAQTSEVVDNSSGLVLLGSNTDVEVGTQNTTAGGAELKTVSFSAIPSGSILRVMCSWRKIQGGAHTVGLGIKVNSASLCDPIVVSSGAANDENGVFVYDIAPYDVNYTHAGVGLVGSNDGGFAADRGKILAANGDLTANQLTNVVITGNVSNNLTTLRIKNVFVWKYPIT